MKERQRHFLFLKRSLTLIDEYETFEKQRIGNLIEEFNNLTIKEKDVFQKDISVAVDENLDWITKAVELNKKKKDCLLLFLSDNEFEKGKELVDIWYEEHDINFGVDTDEDFSKLSEKLTEIWGFFYLHYSGITNYVKT